ncbi:hypothetical protein NEFER03_1515 [Nematocida sp. LUAm3]|nr:hypothetical protein NEFER03_1515 [Nematocida sp. LUAm3]KAI5174548.1 hypothetical protein NEFER02_0669 [Nematocida sp. LUAm2]KAI5178046.1 hypothetical protein NEFER01_1228 [Nematocida sp. LUAm1]
MNIRYFIVGIIFFFIEISCTQKRALEENEEHVLRKKERPVLPPLKMPIYGNMDLAEEQLASNSSNNSLNPAVEKSFISKEPIRVNVNHYMNYSLGSYKEQDIIYWDIVFIKEEIFFNDRKDGLELLELLDNLALRKMITQKIIATNGKVLFWLTFIQHEDVSQESDADNSRQNPMLQDNEKVQRMLDMFSGDTNIVVTYLNNMSIMQNKEEQKINSEVMKKRLDSLRNHLKICMHTSGFLIYYNVLFTSSLSNNSARVKEFSNIGLCPVSLFKGLDQHKHVYVVYDEYASYHQTRVRNIDNSVFLAYQNINIEDFSSIWPENIETVGISCSNNNIQLSAPFFLQKMLAFPNINSLHFTLPNNQSEYASNTQFEIANFFPKVTTINAGNFLGILKAIEQKKEYNPEQNYFKNIEMLTITSILSIEWALYIAKLSNIKNVGTVEEIMQGLDSKNIEIFTEKLTVLLGSKSSITPLEKIIYASKQLVIIKSNQNIYEPYTMIFAPNENIRFF